jgi:uncharacterized coiled-coil DUF342 family protein
MEELIKLKADLAECRRHADNHRRSRDYHKEQAAKLRKEIDLLTEAVSWWHNEHDQLDAELSESQRHHRAWMAFSILMASYAIGMTVLFAWCIRS